MIITYLIKLNKKPQVRNKSFINNNKIKRDIYINTFEGDYSVSNDLSFVRLHEFKHSSRVSCLFISVVKSKFSDNAE